MKRYRAAQKYGRQPQEIIIRVIHEEAPKECQHYWVPDTNSNSSACVERCVKCGQVRGMPLIQVPSVWINDGNDYPVTITTSC